jgi:hypothetical protein
MPDRSRFRGALGLSLLVHVGLLLAPIGWWGALGFLGGGELSGAGIPGPWRGDEAFLVSEVAPGVTAPPPAPPVEPAPREEPPPLPDAVETADAEPETEPEPPVAPVPGTGVGSDEAVATAGTDSAGGAPAAGTPDGSPGEAAGAGEGAAAAGVPTVYVSPKPLVVGLLELPEPRVIEARLLISREGRVIRVEPVEADLDPELRAEVERVAATMRFVPGRRDGKPVEAWCTLGFASRGN